MKGSLMLWTCEIQGAQHMIFKQKKKKFSSRKRQQGPGRAQQAQQNNAHLVQHTELKG